MVELLINKGASFDIPALNKKVALHFAAEGGHVYACKALLELGADPMKTDKVRHLKLLLSKVIEIPQQLFFD